MGNHTSEIKIKVGLDENKVPEKMHWSAPDGGVDSAGEARTRARQIDPGEALQCGQQQFDLSAPLALVGLEHLDRDPALDRGRGALSHVAERQRPRRGDHGDRHHDRDQPRHRPAHPRLRNHRGIARGTERAPAAPDAVLDHRWGGFSLGAAHAERPLRGG